ncbi:MAG: 5'/3'-nucleotidase SurE, partial [Candidatus Humimicrobiaceae bacterium]
KEKRDGKFFGYAVDGTPADCVKLAVKAILKAKPHLLISGINRGANVGEDIIYSGTVSAATEGTVCDVPSIAISVDNLKNPDYSFAARFARKMAKIVLDKGLPKKTLLNINIPNAAGKDIKGVKVTCQSTAKFKDYFIKRVDPRGRDYYWMDGDFVEITKNADDDYTAIKNNYISITPVHYDLTAYNKIKIFENWKINKNIR